jgi:DNA-binding transcriptional LysR family regulator
MELRYLEQIVAVRKAGSLSGGAKLLRIAQPTLSKSIARLEAQLGVSLFDRSSGNARPTVYGEFVADRAEELLLKAAGLTRELKQLARGEAGSLRIGVGPATRLHPLPDVIRQAAQAFPQLQLETRYESAAAMMRSLLAGSLDLAFCHAEVAAPLQNFIRIKIFEDRQVAVVRPGHPALAAAPLSPNQLLRFPIASVGTVPSFRRWLGQLEPEGAQNLKAFLSDDYGLVKERPLRSDFVARGPRFVFEQELAAGKLVELALDWDSRYECWMLTTEANWHSPVVKAIAQFAKAAGRSRN